MKWGGTCPFLHFTVALKNRIFLQYVWNWFKFQCFYIFNYPIHMDENQFYQNILGSETFWMSNRKLTFTYEVFSNQTPPPSSSSSKVPRFMKWKLICFEFEIGVAFGFWMLSNSVWSIYIAHGLSDSPCIVYRVNK